MDRMYKNIGSKLKGLAKFVAIMGVIFGALIALAGPSGSGAVLTGIIIGLTSSSARGPCMDSGNLSRRCHTLQIK
jgi:hypothetical protein